jgi:hypothetical protein
VSKADSETLYLQGDINHTPYTVTAVRDDSARLATTGEAEPMHGEHIAAAGSSIACASGKVVWLTAPMRPHARPTANRFFQFSAPVGMMIKAGAGLFVSTDKTYFLANLDSDTPTQREVFPYPALAGTGAELADGRASWMTPYGLAVGSADGSAALISAERFAPAIGDGGAAGRISLDGGQVVVTAIKGARGANPLAAKDFYEVEIVN